MYDRMFSLVISKDTDERILFRFKGFILKIVDVEMNELQTVGRLFRKWPLLDTDYYKVQKVFKGWK